MKSQMLSTVSALVMCSLPFIGLLIEQPWKPIYIGFVIIIAIFYFIAAVVVLDYIYDVKREKARRKYMADNNLEQYI